MDPVDQISDLLGQLKAQNQLAPLCLSTLGANGFPNSRFVDLKEVADGRLFFGTDGRSPKAAEFGAHPQVSLCAWWERLQVQVRVRGTVEIASAAFSDKVFATRNPTAKALAVLSRQSDELGDEDGFRAQVTALVRQSGGRIERPAGWSVYGVVPKEVEILTFSEDRIHLRRHYRREGDGWRERVLTP